MNKPNHAIRQWRKFRGLTQEGLAVEIGATHGAISQLERGLINYTQPTLEAIAAALRCSPADLLRGPPDTITGAERNRLQSVIDGLDEPARSVLLAAGERLLEQARQPDEE